MKSVLILALSLVSLVSQAQEQAQAPAQSLTACLPNEPSVCLAVEGLPSSLMRKAYSFTIVSTVPLEQISLEAVWDQPDLRVTSVPLSVVKSSEQEFAIRHLIFAVGGTWSINVTIDRVGRTDLVSLPVAVDSPLE